MDWTATLRTIALLLGILVSYRHLKKKEYPEAFYFLIIAAMVQFS